MTLVISFSQGCTRHHHMIYKYEGGDAGSAAFHERREGKELNYGKAIGS